MPALYRSTLETVDVITRPKVSQSLSGWRDLDVSAVTKFELWDEYHHSPGGQLLLVCWEGWGDAGVGGLAWIGSEC